MKFALAVLFVEAAESISMQQIASYWISKHGKDNCQTATAVAMAESGGNCNARNVNSDSHSSVDRGLWQINDYWHPECSDSCAYDCSCNAGCAVNVWQTSGWSAWATYNAGLHKKYLNDAATACGYSAEEVEKQALESSLNVGISMQQIASYWISKHGKDNCQTATAVAMAESGGNCNARNVNSDSHSSVDRGLWQINDYWHPECSDSCAYDCSCNAGCAVNVWQTSGWSAWATYNAGLHKKYLNDAATACGYSAEEVEKQALESSLNVGISMQQIASYWISKHGKDNCQTATAVAMAESGGNCNARNVNSDSHSSVDRGLWQINDYWHPECSDSCAYDCSCNAGCAVNVWQTSGWSAWATYNAGLHKKYLNDAATACGYSNSEESTLELESSLEVGYSPSAAVSWADSHCGDNDGTQCAEFASNALKAGGHANGCFYTYVPDLDNCLRKNAGWKQTSFPCSKGSVVIWYDGQGPYHAAISRGDGTIDQHNPNRCQTSGSWGSNYCLSPPSFTATANLTVMV